MSQFSEWLSDLICSTAWGMTPPKAYGTFHLVFTFAGLAVSFLLAWLLRNVGEKGNRIVLMSAGGFLLLTEIYKQLFYFYYIGKGSYQWWIFPFQLCSVPMYFCLIAPLLKPGKVQRAMYDFMMIYNLLSGFMAFVEPSGLIHEYWTLTLHAFIWHMMLVFIGLYLALSKRTGGSFKEYGYASVTFICLCALAFIINVCLRKVSDGSVNMFYVGPSNSPIIVFKQISQNFGWYFSTLAYIPTLCLGSLIFFLPIRAYKKKQEQKQTVSESETGSDAI